MARTTARIAVMQMLYEHISGGEGGEDTIQMVYDELREEQNDTQIRVRLEEPDEEDRLWMSQVYLGVMEKLDELDEVIGAAAKGWTVERMPHVDLTILRLAAWEILYEEDVPGNVAISEAVELANRYSDPDKSSRFINGVLGTILREKEAKKA